MTTGDMWGLLAVYLYVALLILFTEKGVNNSQLLSRKILHIGVGNIIFLLPLFDNRWVMAFVAAAPFIALTLLISPYSPIDLISKTSSEGHGLGLVYYAISWTILALLFFDRLEIIAVGIVAMSFGDGFASLIGIKYGKRTYTIFGDKKSLEGSIAMITSTVLVTAFALLFFNSPIIYFLLIIPAAVVATLAESITPKGLDNLTVSLSAAVTYYLLVMTL
ncbi:MAG: diacylglycerol/polyprenol kinase family protein [Candidatus Saliniplasma sp.]